MAYLNCHFNSKALGFNTKVDAFLPQPDRNSPNWTVNTPPGKFPVLYLLHGYGNDETEWTHYSTIRWYIENYPLVVIIPSVQRCTYVDIGQTHRYWTYLSEELPALVKTFFPISERREDTFVAGLSMGGYGAFKLGLSFPDRYAAAASISGNLDFAQTADIEPSWQHDIRFNFGDQARLEGGPHDLFYLARQMAKSPGPKTRLYACTGTEDFIYEGNQAFKQLAENLGLDFTYEEGPGEHNWAYVDPMIPRMLDWLGLQPHNE